MVANFSLCFCGGNSLCRQANEGRVLAIIRVVLRSSCLNLGHVAVKEVSSQTAKLIIEQLLVLEAEDSESHYFDSEFAWW